MYLGDGSGEFDCFSPGSRWGQLFGEGFAGAASTRLYLCLDRGGKDKKNCSEAERTYLIILCGTPLTNRTSFACIPIPKRTLQSLYKGLVLAQSSRGTAEARISG